MLQKNTHFAKVYLGGGAWAGRGQPLAEKQAPNGYPLMASMRHHKCWTVLLSKHVRNRVQTCEVRKSIWAGGLGGAGPTPGCKTSSKWLPPNGVHASPLMLDGFLLVARMVQGWP